MSLEAASGVNSQNLCGLCNEKSSKYCCPRCNIFYCSLDCYKSETHIHCSESFYKDCVNEELASNYVDEESKQKMIDILKKMQNGDLDDPKLMEQMLGNVEDNEGTFDSDDEEAIDLQERIKGLNLDDADKVWNVLTEDERNEFEAILSEGDVGAIIPQWQPWWSYKKEEKLIQDVNTKDTTEEDAIKKCPPIVKVPAFSTLTAIKPSPAIRYNITNVLASYAFLIRYFNGDIDIAEGTIYLLSICGNLDINANFDDPTIAVEAVVQRCLQSDLIETDASSLDVMKHDVICILQGPSKEKRSHYCRAALSHLHKILSEAKTAKKIMNKIANDKSDFSRKFPQHTRDHLPSLDVSKVKKCIRKIEYYLSFIESSGVETE